MKQNNIMKRGAIFFFGLMVISAILILASYMLPPLPIIMGIIWAHYTAIVTMGALSIGRLYADAHNMIVYSERSLRHEQYRLPRLLQSSIIRLGLSTRDAATCALSDGLKPCNILVDIVSFINRLLFFKSQSSCDLTFSALKKS